jgi:hypothetical protein
MADTKISGATIITGTDRVASPVARNGNTTAYKRTDMLNASTNPAVTNDVDEGYHPGSLWTNTSTGVVFLCTDATDGAAVWRPITPSPTGWQVPYYADSNIYLTSPVHGTVSSTATMVADRLWMTPVFVPARRSFTTMAIIVTTLAAGNCRLGVYNMNTVAQPTTLITEAATPATTGSTGVRTATISATLNPGWYYLAANFDATPIVVAQAATLVSAGGTYFTASSLRSYYGLFRADTYAAMEADESGNTFTHPSTGPTTTLPIIGIR